ncbi:MAG: DUF4245 domain-containing protein [Microbacteriaceae bacterium]|nr:DUF4245 domain-containing protein [Microbacteriaceae bacterium]
MAKQKQPAVVAELGRPETPAETAARKAEESRLYRSRKTVNNLVYSLLVTVAIMGAFVLLVPRGTGDYPSRNVDIAEIAKNQTTTAGQPLATPQVGDGWLAKQAQLRFDKASQTTYWYIGYTTPSKGYAAVMQGYNKENQPGDLRWVTERLEQKQQTGTAEFAGKKWHVYDHRKDSDDGSNVRWGFVTEHGKSRIIISGTGTEAEIRALAEATIKSLNTK